MIFLYYIIKNRLAKRQMKGNEFIVKTIVTTDLIKEIAKKNHIELYDCYTGFKWIARQIRLNEGIKKYIGGGEESYGFLAEDFVRDKDAVSACSLLAEICAWAKDQGKTLYDILMDIYKEYGFSYNKTVNVVKPGKTGADEIKEMMNKFHSSHLKELAGSPVVETRDYQKLQIFDAEGKAQHLDMPEPSNVIQWFAKDGTKVSVRPSGTEPKIKFYIEVMGTMKHASDYEAACALAETKVEAIKKSIGLE
jgi:phosphoglucomutase